MGVRCWFLYEDEELVLDNNLLGVIARNTYLAVFLIFSVYMALKGNGSLIVNLILFLGISSPLTLYWTPIFQNTLFSEDKPLLYRIGIYLSFFTIIGYFVIFTTLSWRVLDNLENKIREKSLGTTDENTYLHSNNPLMILKIGLGHWLFYLITILNIKDKIVGVLVLLALFIYFILNPPFTYLLVLWLILSFIGGINRYKISRSANNKIKEYMSEEYSSYLALTDIERPKDAKYKGTPDSYFGKEHKTKVAVLQEEKFDIWSIKLKHKFSIDIIGYLSKTSLNFNKELTTDFRDVESIELQPYDEDKDKFKIVFKLASSKLIFGRKTNKFALIGPKEPLAKIQIQSKKKRRENRKELDEMLEESSEFYKQFNEPIEKYLEKHGLGNKEDRKLLYESIEERSDREIEYIDFEKLLKTKYAKDSEKALKTILEASDPESKKDYIRFFVKKFGKSNEEAREYLAQIIDLEKKELKKKIDNCHEELRRDKRKSKLEYELGLESSSSNQSNSHRATLSKYQINLLEALTKSNIDIDQIDEMNWKEFEEFLENVFERKGYDAKSTKGSGDQGADVLAEDDFEKIVIQAKRYDGNVSNSAIQEVVASLELYEADRGIVITNSGFTNSAKELAESNNIELWNRNKLKQEINDHL